MVCVIVEGDSFTAQMQYVDDQKGLCRAWSRTFGRTILDSSGASKNKSGRTWVGAISKTQKYQKDFKVSSILLQYQKNQKIGPNWCARGSIWDFSSILHSVSNIKKLKGNFFRRKSLNPKKRGNLSDFLTSIVAKHQKIEGRPFF